MPSWNSSDVGQAIEVKCSRQAHRGYKKDWHTRLPSKRLDHGMTQLTEDDIVESRILLI
jgi:hypothetical protein